jgi:hypothetical protein
MGPSRRSVGGLKPSGMTCFCLVPLGRSLFETNSRRFSQRRTLAERALFPDDDLLPSYWAKMSGSTLTDRSYRKVCNQETRFMLLHSLELDRRYG